MANTIHPCDDLQLQKLLCGNAQTIGDEAMIAHLEDCPHCQSRLQELAAGAEDWKQAASVLTDSDGTAFGRNAFPGKSQRTERPGWTESMAKDLLSLPPHPEMLGRIVRYDVERLIGSGGMGIVFKAHDTELNRVVAIKLLAPYLASSGSAKNRFAREARSAAGVVDDHVVPIFNVESESDPPFLVMQYIAGGSLQEKLDGGGPLEVSEVLRVGLQTAKGLAAAHAQGLIHRDVKPSNILLDEGVERAVLTDFGLARAENDASLTRSGFHPGTPHYMSPEQVRGESIDGRSDLFGLGCVMYAACAGHPPFRAETSYAVLRRVTDESPRPIREINADVPEWLERIVIKLLAKSADDRFQSAEEVAELLEDCLAHVQQPATVPLTGCIAELVKSFGSDHEEPKPTESVGGFRFPPIQKIIAIAAFAIPLLFAVLFITIETGKGTITIESDADNVPIVIKKGGKVYDKLTVNRDGKSIRLFAGEYELTFDGQPDSMEIDNDTIVLNWGDESVVRIRGAKEESGMHRVSINSSFERGGGVNAEESGISGDASRGSVEETTLRHRKTASQPQVHIKGAFVPIRPDDRGVTFAPSQQEHEGRDVAPDARHKLPPYVQGLPKKPDDTRAISDIVTDFNLKMSGAESDIAQPPLTVDEVICCCRWMLSTNTGLSADIRQLLLDLTSRQKLADGWTLEGGGRQALDRQIGVYLIQFVNHQTGNDVVVRKRFLRPLRRLAPPSDGYHLAESRSLVDAIAEFNAMHHTIDGKRQPPLTLDEVLTAIVDARTRRNDFGVDNTTYGKFIRISQTHSLPAAAKLEVVRTLGERFRAWSIRIVIPQTSKPDQTHAFEIRRQYVSVKPDGHQARAWPGQAKVRLAGEHKFRVRAIGEVHPEGLDSDDRMLTVKSPNRVELLVDQIEGAGSTFSSAAMVGITISFERGTSARKALSQYVLPVDVSEVMFSGSSGASVEATRRACFGLTKYPDCGRASMSPRSSRI